MSLAAMLGVISFVTTAPAAEMNLETLVQTEPSILGFIANGTGCRPDIEPRVEGNRVTFRLRDYDVRADSNSRSVRENCAFAIKVDLPPGLTVSLDRVTYRGTAKGRLGQVKLYRDYFILQQGQDFSDQRVTLIDYDRTGAPHVYDEGNRFDTLTGNRFVATDYVRRATISQCGGTVNWRANTALQARIDNQDPSPNAYAEASVTRIQGQNDLFLTFDFVLAPCAQ